MSDPAAPSDVLFRQHLAQLDGEIAGLTSNIDAVAGKIAELSGEQRSYEAQRDDAIRLREKLTA